MTGAAVCGDGRGCLEGLRVPDALSARVPAEQRGSGRDGVRLLVTRGTRGDDGRWAVELRTPGGGGRRGVT